MSPLRIVEVIAVLFMLIGTVFTIFLFLDSRHAKNEIEFELKAELLELDIKKDAEARVYYKSKESAGELDSADKSRLEYLEEQLERKYEEQRLIKEKLLELNDG
jgi:hypothetical protein